MSRLDALQEQFPDVPRSVILKMDLMREGIRLSPALNHAARSCIPHFLMWNPEHDFDVSARGEAPEDWILTPWNVRLADGTTIKTKFWNSNAPYEVQREGDHYVLYRNGERVEEVFFHRRPEWYFGRTSDRSVHAAVVQLWAPECWYAVSLRYCQYSKSDDQCRFCCLMPSDDPQGSQLAGVGYRVAATTENLAETYAAGVKAGHVRHFSITGGAILNNTKEIEKMAAIFRRLSDERKRLGADTLFFANPSGLEQHELETLKRSGVDGATINLEVWEPKLWPEIVPGKDKFFGRDRYLESIARAVDCFGPWKVNSYFVVGVETVLSLFRSAAESIDSLLRGVAWCLDHKVLPATTMWLPAPGSPWSDKPLPSTEYFIRAGKAIHDLMAERGAYEAARPAETAQCQDCQDCSVNLDHYYAARTPNSGFNRPLSADPVH